MKIFTKKLNEVILAKSSILGWVIFFLPYFILKNISLMQYYSAYFPLISETGLDFFAAILFFKLWKKQKNQSHKKIILFSLFSFATSLIADLIYNIFINLFNFKYENTIIEILFDIPFALFLSLQLTVWANIILLNKKYENNKKIIYMPNVILSLLIFIIFIFGLSWKIKYFSITGLFQLIDTTLETIGFILATICLARSKNFFIRFITIGYLILVSSDFIIRYYVVSGSVPYLNTFESTWALGLLLISIGCYSSLKTNNNNIFQLLATNSLQSQITIWSLILWLGSVILFIISGYFFTEYDTYKQLIPSFLSIIVPISILYIMGSSYLSTKISSTLLNLENSVNKFIKTDENNQDVAENNNGLDIFEVKQLKQFILQSINELQSITKIKSEFLMNMSHDFRTPASGIYHMSRTIYKRTDNPELKKLQKLIVDSSEQLMNFIEDVLAIFIIFIKSFII